MKSTLFLKHIALPQDHGSWVFLFSPLIIGLLAGGAWRTDTLLLILAAVCAFLIRQPLTTAVKVYSGRRSRRDLPAARLWTAVYALAGGGALALLLLHGHTYLLYLAALAIPVFIWHLYLVSKRAERRQAGVEILATGILALSAPAAYWMGHGWPDWRGFLLWGLLWLQSAASIVYAYLRLEQRAWKEKPAAAVRWQAGRHSLIYTSVNVLLVFLAGQTDWVSPWLFLAYAIQWGETLWGIHHPAIQARPVTIGTRQLIVSALFSAVFATLWLAFP
ncbi:MAG: hypothetical protein Fur0018_20050 [Anaerolineales bacterium]